MIGIIPAAGRIARIPPAGCMKELLPVGVAGVKRPKAAAEYVVERMVAAGVDRIAVVISAEKSDIVRFFAERDYDAQIFFVVQPRPRGVCDALFRAAAFAAKDDRVLIGLPDTIWFPEDGYARSLNTGADLDLICFPNSDPAAFEAVTCNTRAEVTRVDVKSPFGTSLWVWGAATMSSGAFDALHWLWESRGRADHRFGDLLNAYIAGGNVVHANCCGEDFVDVGTAGGYRAAQNLVHSQEAWRSEAA